MKIKMRELHHNTYNFFSQQIRPIFFISVFVTFINMLIDVWIKPEVHIISVIEDNKLISANLLLELINNMNFQEKHELLKYSFLKILELLISKTLLLGSIVTLISHVSGREKKSIMSSVRSLFSLLPGLFILNSLVTSIIQLGFVLLIVPGVLLSIILSLSPIIFSCNKKNLIDSICLSIYLSWKNIKIIGPSLLFFMCIKFIVMTTFYNIHYVNKNIIFTMSSISTNMLFAILTIYLFRFYMIIIRS